MTKITKNSFAKKLAKYGALSVAIAGVADATGQVVYTDVDPDFAGGLGDNFAIDFDGDGTTDVDIVQFNNGNYELVQAQGDVVTDPVGGFYYAANLALGDMVDSSSTVFNSFGDMCSGPGYTGSQFCGTEGYIGVQFQAGGGTTHYAWVRVGTGDSSSFTVFEYAFEATPDTAIEVGDEGVLGVQDETFNNFSYFVDDNALNLAAATAMDNVTIYNIAGQQVIANDLNSANERVNISSLNSGVYLATVTIEGSRKTIKFVKQ